MAGYMKAPTLSPKGFSTKELTRLYRVIDLIEECANMGQQTIETLIKEERAATDYLDDLICYLAAQRSAIVDALRSRPFTDDGDGQSRIATIVQHEAWCEEFHKETLDQLNSSALAREAY